MLTRWNFAYATGSQPALTGYKPGDMAHRKRAYKFVDLRPALQFTRSYWDAMTQLERTNMEHAAARGELRIEIIDEPEPPSS